MCVSPFLLYWVALGAVRRWGGIQIVLDGANQESQRQGYGVGFLLGWTAAIAAMTALANQVSWSNLSLPGGNAIDVAKDYVAQSSVFALMLANPVIGGVLVLGTRFRPLTGFVGFPLIFVATTAAAALTMSGVVIGDPAAFKSLWWDVLDLGAGATIATSLFGIALRLGGYRLATDASA